MKLSWSQNLFLRINKQIGGRPWLDRLMTFCGHYLIYVLVASMAFWASAVFFRRGPEEFLSYAITLGTVGVCAFAVSWTIALLLPRKRPIGEFPHIREIFRPVGAWKSFPSDHTIASFVIAEVTWKLGVPIWFGLLLFLFALCIGLGRVYVGVHYPRDIIGGTIVASVCTYFSSWLVHNITEPVLRFLNVY